MYGRYDTCAPSPGLTNTRIASANNPSLHVARFRPPKITDLKEGILDPFPLLRGQESAPSTGKGRAKQVNPLLLVTERRGTASSLHYGAFPLDAFNTDGASSLFFSGSQRLSVEATFLCPQSKTSDRSVCSYNSSLWFWAIRRAPGQYYYCRLLSQLIVLRSVLNAKETFEQFLAKVEGEEAPSPIS